MLSWTPQLVYGGYGNHVHLFFVLRIIVKIILDVVMVISIMT